MTHPPITDDMIERAAREPLYDDCPACGASMDGGPMPEDIRHNYSPPYRWSRAIALYSREQDRTVAYQCPDCSAALSGKEE